MPELVISDGLWKRAFGGDPGILGKSMRMDTDLYQVIGVMPPDYHDPGKNNERQEYRGLGRNQFLRRADGR